MNRYGHDEAMADLDDWVPELDEIDKKSRVIAYITRLEAEVADANKGESDE